MCLDGRHVTCYNCFALKKQGSNTTDPAIRAQLLAMLRNIDHSAIVHEELPLSRGRAKADISVVNGHMCGYEIKSDRDNTGRLQRQVAHYNLIFDFCFVVVGQKHYARIVDIVPAHWGIWIADLNETGVSMGIRREPKLNTQIDSNALVRLLWRDEATRIAKEHGLLDRSALVSELWPLLTKNLSVAELATEVRTALKARGGWQSDRTQIRGGG